MRADAARNIEKVLRTGARLLAQDPTTTIAAIAVAAEVDRRTVYRRFDSRETLLAAVYEARLDAVGKAIAAARLTEAPVAGLFRDDFPEGWIQALLIHTVNVAAHEFPGIDAAQAADFAVDSLLRGTGRT